MRGAWHAAFLLGAAVLLLSAVAAPGDEADGRFRYNTELKKCINARNDEGLNPPAKGEPDNECADYRGKIVVYVQGENGNFRGANFNGAQFRYLNLMSRADFTGAVLTNIIGDSADVGDANFSGADFTGASLKPCRQDGSGFCLPGARFDAGTKLPFTPDEALARGMVAMDEAK